MLVSSLDSYVETPPPPPWDAMRRCSLWEVSRMRWGHEDGDS